MDKMNEIIIRPKKTWSIDEVREIWRYRELFYIFVWREIKIRYRQTMVGIVWVLLQPLISMLVFTIFFGNFAKIPSGNLPYTLFVFCGLVFWTFFSNSLSLASDSLIVNENIIKKVYFPKIILPLSSVLTGLVDFSINFIMLLAFASFLGYFPSKYAFIVFPFAIIMTAMSAIGIGLFLASINVKYRDIRYILPFFTQFLLFLTPVIYPLAIVSDRNKYIMAINPMTSVVELVRFVFGGGGILDYQYILLSIGSSLFFLFFGFWYFQKTERFFADII